MSDPLLNDETLASHQFDCPHCEKPIPLDETKTGAESTCPHCTQRIVIPADGYKTPSPSKVNRAIDRVWPVEFDGQTLSAFLGGQGVDVPAVDLDEAETEAATDDAPPQILETDKAQRYEVGDMVAKGGMGAILAAKDVNVRRNVAMKVMLREADAGSSEMLRFIEEAQVTGQLEHPNIVPVHELGIDVSGNVFYTMKFVRGVTLKDILVKIRTGNGAFIKEFPLSRLLTIFLKVCDAMAFAHSRGVIHRDLKPGNIMVGEYGEVLVLDWGLAKIIGREESGPVNYGDELAPQPEWLSEDVESYRADEDTYKTMAGTIMGTPTFMSPEQALGEIEKTDARADIYTLGGILYNILTLHTPIISDSINDLLMKIVGGDTTSPEYWNPDGGHSENPEQETTLSHCPNLRVPSSLSAVAMKALATKRDDRYQTVKAMQADIEAYQTGFATEAEEASLMRQIWLLVMRHRREFILATSAIAVLVVVVSGFLVSLKMSYDREKKARIAEQDQKEKVMGLNVDLESEKLKTEQELYNSRIAFAKECLFATPARPVLARNVLAACKPDFQHFEWAFLRAKAARNGTARKIGGWHAPSNWAGRMAIGAAGDLVVVAGDTQVATGGCRIWWFRRQGDEWKQETKAFPGLVSARGVVLDGAETHIAIQGSKATYIVRLADKTVSAIVQNSRLGRVDYLDMQSDRIGFRRGEGGIDHFQISTLETGDGIPKPRSDIVIPQTKLTACIVTTNDQTLRFKDGKTLLVEGDEGKRILSKLFVSPGRRFLVAARKPGIALHDAETFRKLWQMRLPNSGSEVRRIEMSPDGRYMVVTAYGGRSTLLLRTENGTTIASFGFSAQAVRFSSDSHQMVLSDGNRVLLLDPSDGKTVASFYGHDSDVNQLAFRGGDRVIVSVSASQILTTRIEQITASEPVEDGVVGFGGKMLFVRNGRLVGRVARGGVIVATSSTHLTAVAGGGAFDLSQPGKLGAGRLGEVVQYKSIEKAWPDDAVLVGAAATPSGKRTVLWGHRKTRRSDLVIGLIKSDDGKKLWAQKTVGAFASHRLSLMINQSDQVWDSSVLAPVDVFEDPDLVNQDKWYATGHSSMFVNGKRIVYRAGKYVIAFPDGQELEVSSGVRTHAGRLVSTVAFAANNERVALVVGGTDVHVYSLGNRTKLAELTGGQTRIAALCMSADGKRVVVWGKDGSLRFWSAEKGIELLAFDVPRPRLQSCELQFVDDESAIRGETNDLQGRSFSFVMKADSQPQ